MIKKSLLILVFLCVIISLNAQEWLNTAMLEGSDDFNINSTALLDDSTVVVFGTFKGRIEAPADTTSRGGSDIFVAVFQDGTFQWLQSIGSSSNEFGGQMIIYNDEIYLTGSYPADCYFPDGSFLTTEGLHDIFLAKFSSSGSLLLKKKIVSGANNQVPLSLDIDKNNELVLTGFYKDTVGFGAVGYDGRPTTFTNFFAKFDLNGNNLLSKVYDGNNTSTRFSQIKAFDDGYYIAGTFIDTVYLDVEDIVSRNGTADIFLYKINYDGVGQWVRRTYGNNNDVPGSMTQDNYGNNYFTGFFKSDTIIADSTSTLKSIHNIVNHNTNNSLDFFIFKYNKSGNLIWSNGYGGEGNDWARSIETRNGFVYLSGYFSDTLIFKDDTIGTSSLTDEDPFIGIFNTDGDKIKAVNVKGSGENLDHAQSINLNSKNQAIISGFFESPTLTFDDDDILSNSNPGIRNLFIGTYIPPFSIAITNFSNITCNNGFNGELTGTPYFGVPPYTYSWSHNGTLNDSTATGLSAGTYFVTVTDFLDSTAIAQHTLSEPGAFLFNPVITQVTTCSNSSEGAINLNVTGGNGGNAYQWFESDGGSGVILTAEDQSGLTIGTYSVTVTDSESCTGDTVIYITGPDPITFGGSVVTDSSNVEPGAIDLVCSGGSGDPASFTFNWQGPTGPPTHSEDTSNLSPGNYSVTVTDLHLCEFDTMFNVANLDTFYIFISDYKDACYNTFNGNATVSYSSPHGHTAITYLWDANASNQTTAQATGLASGRYYYVTVTDTENTPNTVLVDSVFIDELSYNFAGSLAGTSTLDCYGDTDGYIDLSITTAGTLPYSYNWSNSETTQDITNLPIGTYSVTATDANECTFSITNYVIDQPDALAAVAEIVNSPTCNGDLDGEVTVLRNGGTVPYTYQWNDLGSQTTQNANGLDAGYYTVTVTDFNSCTAVSSINLTEPEAITIDTTVNHVSCNSGAEGSIQLTVSGGTTPFTYFWSTNNGTGLVVTDKNQSGLTAGKYYFTATDDHNCTYEDSVEITEPLLLEITNEEKTDITTCNGDNTGTITITATGGTGVLTYILNPGAIQTNSTGAFTGISAGTYTVDVDDENSCGPVTSSSIEITEPTQISITAETPTDISCNGLTDGQIVITASGGTGALQYSINNGTIYQASGTFSGLAQGTNYQVKVQDANLCEVAGSTLIITEPTELAIDSTVIDITCNGSTDGSIDITASGGTIATVYTYNWSTTDGSGLVADSEDQTGLGAGTYDLTVTDDNLCTVTASISINEPTVINLESSNAINPTCNGSTDGSIDITISGGTVATVYIYSWATTDGSGLVADAEDQTGLSAGTYDVTVTDDNSCASVFAIVLDNPLEISIDSENLTDASSQTTADGTITVVATGGTGNLTYDLNPGDDSNITGIFNTLLPGDYTVDVTDENACGPVSSSTITVGYTNAIDDLIISDKIKLYPNPTSAKLNVEIDFEIDDVYKIEILTISGQVLFNKEIKSHGITKEELDLSNYPKGIYFIRIYNNQFIFKEKILLQ